jgi:hypothetical protein
MLRFARNHPVMLRVPPLLEKEGRKLSPPLTRRGGAAGDGAVWGVGCGVSAYLMTNPG